MFVFLGDTNEGQRLIAGKSILLISTPHSGKTTLIEGIMNYVLGVRFDDDFRFCLPLDISDQVWKYCDHIYYSGNVLMDYHITKKLWLIMWYNFNPYTFQCLKRIRATYLSIALMPMNFLSFLNKYFTQYLGYDRITFVYEHSRTKCPHYSCIAFVL